MISLIVIKAQDVTIFDIDATSFGFQGVLGLYLTGQHPTSQNAQTRHGFHLCNHHKKHVKIKSGLKERVAVNHPEYEKGQKRDQKYKLVERFDLWIELEF